jgi:molybdopterin converting factor small subunit
MADAGQLNDALAANYMLVVLEIRSWSGKRTDKDASREVIANKGATKDSGRFVKNLLASADAELVRVHAVAQSIRAFVYSQTLPWSGSSEGAKRGDRLLAATRSFEFLKELNAIKREYDLSVQALVSAWPTRVAEALGNLGALASQDDYPDANAVRQMFGVTVDLRPVPTMADFSRINVPSELADALGQRNVQQEQTKFLNAMDELKERLLKELQRMALQLGKAGAGEKTRLYDSLVTNVQTLVGLLRSMNVSNNAQLSELADKIERQLLSHPVEVFRNSQAKAAEVAAQAQQLAVDAALESLWKIE